MSLPKTIWWCEEHRVSRWSEKACWRFAGATLGGERTPPCRMVKFEIHPVGTQEKLDLLTEAAIDNGVDLDALMEER